MSFPVSPIEGQTYTTSLGTHYQFDSTSEKWFIVSQTITGVQGATGVSGYGVTGIQGATGTAGIKGETGVAGIDGQTGTQGTTGVQGLQGVTGVLGIDGQTGPQGTTGIAGVNGQTGVAGSTGVQGATGVAGQTGVQGQTGIQGTTGVAGQTGVQGQTGVAGQTGVQGQTGVAGQTGVQGTQGNTGIQGTTGVQGQTGVQGTTGVAGQTGIQGQTGVAGATGVQGIQGQTGVVGQTGVQGITGLGTTLPTDIQRYGFMNQTETTLRFDGTSIVTLGDVGSGWSYYRNGVKYSISGDKTSNLLTIDNPLIDSSKYYVYIDSTNGSLTASKTVWTLNDTKLPVAIVAWDSTANPKYFLQEERHSCLIDRREHLYLHNTRGTQYITGADLLGYTLNTTTDAANTFSIGQAVIADEDIYQTLLAVTDGNGTDATNYTIVYRKGASVWTWAYSDMPFSYTASGYINWDNNGTLTQGTGGTGGSIRYYNTYIVLTNTQGNARFIFVPGQGQFTTTATAYAEVFANFNLTNFPKTEWVALYQLTWQTGVAGLTNKGKCQLTRAPQRITTSAITVSSTTPVSHNSLAGLQGGSVPNNEYYHLSASEYDALIATGITGMGATGIQGTTGVAGDTGIQGTTGIQGKTGVQGNTGLQGPTGIQGITGTQGTTGAGIQGATGVQGVTGSALQSVSTILTIDKSKIAEDGTNRPFIFDMSLLSNSFWNSILKADGADITLNDASTGAVIPRYLSGFSKTNKTGTLAWSGTWDTTTSKTVRIKSGMTDTTNSGLGITSDFIYTMDDATGSPVVNISRPGYYDGTCGGGALPDQSGNINKSIYIQNVNANINMGNIPTTNISTMSYNQLVKGPLNTTSYIQSRLDYGVSVTDYLHSTLHVGQGTFYWTFVTNNVGGTIKFPSTYLTADVWNTLGFSFNGSGGTDYQKFTPYVNGLAVPSNDVTYSASVPALTPNSPTIPWYFGAGGSTVSGSSTLVYQDTAFVSTAPKSSGYMLTWDRMVRQKNVIVVGDPLTNFQGDQGATGLQGATGIQGHTGVQGITGILGSTGIQGSTGVSGSTGVQGQTGVQGATGIQGQTGIKGTTGVDGQTGLQGRTGVQGATGIQGTTGVQGATGIQGVTGAGLSVAETWVSRGVTGASTSTFGHVCYGNGLFVVGTKGATAYVNEFYTSSDGVNWLGNTSRNLGASSRSWNVAYGNGRFAALDMQGYGGASYSSDGSNWSEVGVPTNTWTEVTFGNGLFVGVSGGGTNRVITSPDGMSWTACASADETSTWESVCYGNGTFVAVAATGSNKIMTSPNGTSWVTRSGGDSTNTWYSVCYGNGLFVAVGDTGAARVMTSPQGITWTLRSSSVAESAGWYGVCYGNGKFVATGYSASGPIIMTSSDAITWAAQTAPSRIALGKMAYGNGMFLSFPWYAPYGANVVFTSGSTIENIPYRPQTTLATLNVVNGLHVGSDTTVAGDNNLIVDGDIYSTNWTNWSSSLVFSGGGKNVTGWSSTTNPAYYYKVIGKTIHLKIYLTGTSDANSVQIPLPYATKAFTGPNTYSLMKTCVISDNGGAYILGIAYVGDASVSYIIVNPGILNGSAWTTSGTKTVIIDFSIDLA